MNMIQLAWKSLKHRMFATLATIFSIVLSLVLLLSIERIRRSVQENFTQTVSGVDLIVGARTGSLQLVLYSVFNIGQATNNISYDNYNKIKNRPEVEWTIPYSLGDGHKGYRVVATNNDFFKYYQFRSQQKIELADGNIFNSYFDVVLGAEVAQVLNYNVGDKIVLVHGSTTGDSFQSHDDKPFVVSGIMKPTGTAIDRSLYISLEGMEAIHIDWQSGAAPAVGKEIKVDQIKPDMLVPKAITSFFLKAQRKTQILKLQRDITVDDTEALLAVIPGVVLSELWQSLSQIEFVLKLISALVLTVGLIGMMISLISSMNERRREIAILRSVGATQTTVSKIILFEIVVLLLTSLLLSVLVKVVSEIALGPWLQKKWGLFLSSPLFSATDLMILIGTVLFGLIFSIGPILVFRSRSLKDGLSVKL